MKQIPLTKGYFAIVDDDDYVWLSQWKWYYGSGYAKRRKWLGKKSKIVFMHREINMTPDGFITDHINHNKLDNRKDNLRTCTRTQNNHNLTQKPFTGVRWNNKSKKWEVRIKANRKDIHLGTFSNFKDAKEARKDAELKYWHAKDIKEIRHLSLDIM